MVKTATRSGILQRRFRHLDRGRCADVEPQALVNGAKASALVDRPIPQDVGRERTLGRIPQEPLRQHLDAGKDERRDVAALAAPQPTRAAHMKIAHTLVIAGPGEWNE